MSTLNSEMSATLSSNNVKGTNVQVAVRCRPLNGDERKSGQATVITCDVENKAIRIAYGPVGKKVMKSFAFDRVFGMYSRQEEVFESVVRPIVEETLSGFNCTIFAYGQTGTGKTHTMEGDINSEDEAGIVPRAVKAILEQLEASGAEFTIRVSFLELYNEELQDLLNVSGDKRLKLCEDVKKGVVCQNLEEIAVLNVADIFDILQRGIQQRQTAATLCNKNSSRSHSIFTLKIMIKEYNVEGEEIVRHGQLNLVDLAGSECIGRSGAKNDRAREAGSINQSLLTLGRVITALVDHHGHVPYRDSKLTRLLQESLGGKAKTVIIATLSPSQSAVEETMSTLDYAFRARNIKNQPTVNQKLTKKVLMKEYSAEIEQLRSQLQLTREKNGVYVDPAEYYQMETTIAAQESQLRECEAALKSRNEEFKLVKAENEDLTYQVNQISTELESVTNELISTKDQLDSAKGEVIRAFLELKGTEAVVNEQIVTEETIISTGNSLCNELGAREQDMNKLINKMNVLEAQEKSRLMQTEAFAAKLNSKHQNLIGEFNKLDTHAIKQQQTLGEGIEKMLSHGKNTCESLQQAIDNALKVLVGDTEQGRTDLNHHCNTLCDGFNKTEVSLIAQLEHLKSDLVQWFTTAELTSKNALRLLEEQKKQISVLQANMKDKIEDIQSNCSSFVTSYNTQSTVMRQDMKSLKTEIGNHTAAFLSETAKIQEASNLELRTRAEAMERTLLTMTSDLLRVGSEALLATKMKAEQYCNIVNQQTSISVDSVLNQCDETDAIISDHNKSIMESSSLFMNQSGAQISAIQVPAEEIRKNISEHNSSIGTKRKLVESSINDIDNEITKSTKQSIHQVEVTSTGVQEVLSKVAVSSNEMSVSASNAINKFTNFMGNEGDALKQDISTHFNQTKQIYQANISKTEEMVGEVAQHVVGVSNTVVLATGQTPRKVPVTEKPVMKPTRAHNIIRKETKDRTTSNSLNYENVISSLDQYSNEVVNQKLSVIEPKKLFAAVQNGLENAENSSPLFDAENMPPTNIISVSEKSSRKGKATPVASVTTRSRSTSSNNE